MASITRDGDCWKVQLCVNGIRKMKRLDTKGAAKSWVAKMEVELGKLIDGVSETHTYGDIFQ